jgi:hypothetical protein
VDGAAEKLSGRFWGAPKSIHKEAIKMEATGRTFSNGIVAIGIVVGVLVTVLLLTLLGAGMMTAGSCW